MRIFAALSLLAVPGIASADAPAPCEEAVCNLDTLAPYFAKLTAAREGRDHTPVHIVQIGDSHTAGDVLTGSWRALLQAQMGGGGRGILPPGRPYDGYITRGITASMSSGWRIATTFGKGSAAPRPPLGLSSYSLTATQAGATMGLVADAAMMFDRFVLCGIAGPDAGQVAVRTGTEAEQRIDFAADIITPVCHTMRVGSVQSSVSVTSLDRPVTITSWATFRDADQNGGGGVTLSNLGVVGSQLVHFGRTDDAVLTEELRAYAPDLIILAFGTNEGFAPRFDADGYEEVLRGQVGRIRRLANDVPILLLGAPDALSRNTALRNNAPGVVVGCPEPEGPATRAAPLFAPPALGRVRAIQRKVASELGLAYWDWQARMGGPCSAARWAAAVPAMMRGDHVHFRDAGGAMLAQALQDDLNHAMEAK
ncbi:SGNH/GDSL hydrolase family protein [Sphingomonas sp. So64.6b]|uniref:GDSL-type esterase/lipase family protein n=1 Tax=Sphingomonas sp. So64.6b TaxID=2997354 RepID=UPI0016032A18|nr:GDSL-type esterase/lipase family protein [Sphingomonas sp. So64.6b]QNA86580.1 SGNH/GDSL hydrolase family protein [Sphingomonas sp. So64.6b]